MKACISDQSKQWKKITFSGVYHLLCLLVKEAIFAAKRICIFFLHEYILQIAQMLITPVCSRFLIVHSLSTSSPQILAITCKIFKSYRIIKQLTCIPEVDLRGKSLIVGKKKIKSKKALFMP